jgi:hypothetical protein
MVEVLCYKPESRGVVPMWSLDFLSIYVIFPAALWLWGLLRFWKEWVPENISGGKTHLARKADNLTAICEPIV